MLTLTHFRTVVACIALALLAADTRPAAAQTPAQTPPENLAPYVPTPYNVVEKMLEMAKVTSKDVVYDLGCGDGRIPIMAAKKYGARGFGVDIDPERIAEATANARKEGVEHLVTFELKDAMTVDVSPATVVTLYLLTQSNMKLKPILTKQLKPGSRIVAHAYGLGDWEPHQVEQVEANGYPRTLYLWITDGKVRQ
jgi:SAM-dependent methyltransferase